MIAKYQLLKDGINHLIQKSELDIGAIYFILKDIFAPMAAPIIPEIIKIFEIL